MFQQCAEKQHVLDPVGSFRSLGELACKSEELMSIMNDQV